MVVLVLDEVVVELVEVLVDCVVLLEVVVDDVLVD